MSFGVVRLAFGSARCANVLLMEKILVNGDMIAEVVVLIEKMLRLEPLIYNINAFINSCWLTHSAKQNVYL